MKKIKLTVEVKDVTKSLILRQAAGEGEVSGVPFTYETAIPGGAFIVCLKGKRYMLEPRTFIQALADAVLPSSGNGRKSNG
jgi:hypothetical protein